MDSNLQIISRRTQDDLAEATKDFLSNPDNPRLGHLFATLVDEAKTTKLTRKSLHRGFGQLGVQFTDTEEGIIYECLDYKGDGIAIEDIIVYCMHVTREGYVYTCYYTHILIYPLISANDPPIHLATTQPLLTTSTTL